MGHKRSSFYVKVKLTLTLLRNFDLIKETIQKRIVKDSEYSRENNCGRGVKRHILYLIFLTSSLKRNNMLITKRRHSKMFFKVNNNTIDQCVNYIQS